MPALISGVGKTRIGPLKSASGVTRCSISASNKRESEMSRVSKLGRGLGCLGLDCSLVDWSSCHYQEILGLASWSALTSTDKRPAI